MTCRSPCLHRPPRPADLASLPADPSLQDAMSPGRMAMSPSGMPMMGAAPGGMMPMGMAPSAAAMAAAGRGMPMAMPMPGMMPMMPPGRFPAQQQMQQRSPRAGGGYGGGGRDGEKRRRCCMRSCCLHVGRQPLLSFAPRLGCCLTPAARLPTPCCRRSRCCPATRGSHVPDLWCGRGGR